MIINGVQWSIVFQNPNSINLMRSDGVMTLGVTDCRKGVIFLSSALKSAMLERVLTHEICHACIFSYGIYLDLEEEERLCEFVAIHAREIINKAELFLKNRIEKGAV